LFIDQAVTEYNTPDRLHDLYVGSDLEFHDDVEAISYMNVMDYVGNHHVYRVDQFTMHFSLEARFPFLDHEVVEAAFRIPSHYKVRDHEQKYVLRRVAEQRIAPRCIEMEKKGFGLPMDRWITGPLADLVRDKLVKLAARGLFRPEEIFRRQREFEAGRGNVSHSQIWHMVAVEMWLEAFFDGVTTLHRKTA
jgi:asparagine synthase (glutamine-hydrolysing)